MTSRRPMTRSFSGNGRTSSFGEEDGVSSNGRSESRNTYLSNVRPENRSTWCSVMAQLTEDVQPSFETTLKSKAVSENCNVKFTCVVSGYPAPELKWYKDDMEMDRYCGLPKYEIRRNGKTHTLHIYNCTLDDAAIYQVSASNSKGIVSCSGVLEVGTMNEYQIHQRFFAKLKQKADKKRKDSEVQSKKVDRENLPKERPPLVPERPQRKRPVPKPIPAVREPEPLDQMGAAAEPNGVGVDVKENAPFADGGPEKEVPSPEETSVPKKIKITNDGEAGDNGGGGGRGHAVANGGENCYDGGISLAQFLAETLQSQAAEEKQNTDSSVADGGGENDTEQEREQSKIEEREKLQEEEDQRERDLAAEREKERKRLMEEAHEREKELEKERERERERLSKTVHTGDQSKHKKAHKDHEHGNIQSSISSMLHTVKDFFFGKSKKETLTESKEGESYPPSYQMQQEHRPEPEKPPTDTRPTGHADAEQRVESMEISAPPEPEDAALHTNFRPLQDVQADDVEKAELSAQAEVILADEEMSPSGPPEGEERDFQIESGVRRQQQDPGFPVVPPPPTLHAVSDRRRPGEDPSASPQSRAACEEACPPTAVLTRSRDSRDPPDGNIVQTDGPDLRETPTGQGVETRGDEMVGEDKRHEEDVFSSERRAKEKTEVKSNKQFSGGNTCEATEITRGSWEDRNETWGSKTTDLSADVRATKEAERTLKPPMQETNAGFPPAAASEGADMKTQGEGPPSAEKESGEISKESEAKTPASELGGGEEKSQLGNVAAFASEDGREERGDEIPETEAGRRTAESQMGGEEKSEARTEEPGEAATPAGPQNQESPLEAPVVRWPSEKVPQIQISPCPPEAPDLETAAPEPTPVGFSPATTDTAKPEVKEFTLPLTILALNSRESQMNLLQKHDVTEMTAEERRNCDALASPPMQRDIQEDRDLSPTCSLKGIAQFDVKTQEVASTRQEIETASIPIINVSCTDDCEGNVNTLVSGRREVSESAAAPSFVVPPISVTCHESGRVLGAPTEPDRADAETRPEAPEPDDVKNRNKESEVTRGTSAMPLEGNNSPSLAKIKEDDPVGEVSKPKPPKDGKAENSATVEDLLRNRASVERLAFKPPAHPSLSPASLRKFMSKPIPDSDNDASAAVPVITVDDRQTDKAEEDLSGGSTPTSSLSCESSPRLKRRDSLSLIRSATPEELASGARRKIFIPKSKEDGDGPAGATEAQIKKDAPYMSPGQARRAALLQAPLGQNTPPMERRSPLLSRRKATLEVPKVVEETPAEEPANAGREDKPVEKKKPDPLKAPQVIRKIRGEPFPDASGHLKLWCQFFNVLAESTVKWFRDEEEILHVKRCGGDESQVALAVVLASNRDCGVYGCTIDNEYGSDTTDFLLSADILSEILLRDDLEVGEEIEMTPLLFTKGLGNSGAWGDKYFGRIMMEAAQVGDGCAHKASRVKVIYGLNPVFESGSTCVVKVRNPIAYGTKQESNLAERNLEITKQECKVQNMIREYCKIFNTEARAIENFGPSPEVIPQYLMYRPANSVPYATAEADLDGVFLKYCTMDPKGRLITRAVSEVEQKCCTFQHWIHQWTHGNLLVTRMEGVETKITNIGVVTKSKGYQGLTDAGSPEVFEQFLTHHQCNYYCGLLGLRPLKSLESLQQPKMKGSRSPLLNRKLTSGSGSPQLQRKGQSPQISRKANSSPKVARKVQETEDNKSGTKLKPAESPDVLEMR